MRAPLALVLIGILAATSVRAQSLEQQEKLNQIDKALSAIDSLQALTDKMTKEKKLQCITAIANDAFCECLTHSLPVTVNFVNYVAIITQTKEELEYDKLSVEDKKIVENTRLARDRCASLRR